MHKARGKLSFRIARALKPAALVAVTLSLAFAPAIKTAAQSNGLGITPELNYVVNSGSQHSDTLYINNLSTSQPLNLKLSVVDFEAQDESGAPKLLQAANAPQTPWSLKPYITVPEFVNVDPGKSSLVPFTIKIPEGVGAGSYYSAVQYAAINNANKEQVDVAASADTLIFVNVPGNATEQLSLLQFGSESEVGGNFKSIFSSPPSTFAYRTKNGGNVAESPAGSIVVKNIFGHIAAHIDDANPRSELALIGQTRKFEVCNPKDSSQRNLITSDNCKPLNLKPGIYTAEIELLYGQNGQASHQISAKAIFWYLPLWFVAVFVGVLLVVAYALYYLYRKVSAARHQHKRRR